MDGFPQTIFSFMTKEREHFYVSRRDLNKYFKAGRQELTFLLKEERFQFVKDANPFFKKHLGFIYLFDKKVDYVFADHEIKAYKIEIYNKIKFLFFKIKYDL